jgi:MFS family permease
VSQDLGRQASYRDVFAVGEFRVMWVAQAISLLGNQLAQVALAILVYHRTDSAFLTALAYALSYLPQIIGGPVLSGLADMFPRRAVMICFDLVRLPLVAAMAIPAVPFWALCVLVTGTTVSGVPFTAARSALLPDVLPGDRLALGSAIGNVTDQFSQVIGFATGALIVAWLDPYRALLLDALTFAASALLIRGGVARRPAPSREDEREPRDGQEPLDEPSLWWRATAGMRLVAQDPVLRCLVLFGWLGGFYVIPEALAAPYAHALRQGPAAVGLLMAAMPVGTIVGALVFVRLIPPGRRLAMLGWLAMLACAPLIGSAARPPLPAVLALLAVAGVGSGYQVIAAAAFLQRLPASGRGAAFGFAASGVLAVQGLGFLVGGAVAQAIGPQQVVAVAGAAGVGAAAVLTVAWARVRPGAAERPPAGNRVRRGDVGQRRVGSSRRQQADGACPSEVPSACGSLRSERSSQR